MYCKDIIQLSQCPGDPVNYLIHTYNSSILLSLLLQTMLIKSWSHHPLLSLGFFKYDSIELWYSEA